MTILEAVIEALEKKLPQETFCDHCEMPVRIHQFDDEEYIKSLAGAIIVNIAVSLTALEKEAKEKELNMQIAKNGNLLMKGRRN